MVTVWHKATREELLAEIDRLTRVNAEIRAELAVRDASNATAMVVGAHLLDCAFGD
jgi:hypothetical protein